MKVMSLDLSTSTIGIAVITIENRKPKLLHYEYYKPIKSDKATIFVRLKTTKDYILKLIEKHNPDELVIEEFVQFMKGKSGAKTIIPLALFNRTIGLAWFELTGKEPHMLNVLTIRHKLKFTKELPDKSEMPEIVAKHLEIEFPWNNFLAPPKKPRKPSKKPAKPKKPKKPKKPNKSDLMNAVMKERGVIEEAFDQADSFAVGLAYLKINKLID